MRFSLLPWPRPKRLFSPGGVPNLSFDQCRPNNDPARRKPPDFSSKRRSNIWNTAGASFRDTPAIHSIQPGLPWFTPERFLRFFERFSVCLRIARRHLYERTTLKNPALGETGQGGEISTRNYGCSMLHLIKNPRTFFRQHIQHDSCDLGQASEVSHCAPTNR